MSNKGTILYVGGFELPDRNAAAHRVLNNAKVFRKLGYNVVFCGIDKTIKYPEENAQNIAGFESYPIPYPNAKIQWIGQAQSIKKYRELLNLKKNICLIVCYNLHALILAKLLRLGKKRKIKVVADCTEWYHNKISANPIKLIKSIDTAICMRFLQKKCDGMIAISSYLADYYKKWIEHIITVPPLTDLKKADFDSEPMANGNELLPVELVYCGSPSLTKESLGSVVQCLSQLKDLNYHFTVVGITQEQFSKIYNIVPDLKKITFTGRLSHEEALKVVCKSSYAIIIRPRNRSTMAGFPTKFAEAISVSTAVIANDTSDLTHYLKNGKNGYLINATQMQAELKDILLCRPIPDVESYLFNYHNWIAQFDSFIKSVLEDEVSHG